MSGADAPSCLPLIQIVTCARSADLRLKSALELLRTLGPDIKVDVVHGFIAEDAVVDALYDSGANRRRTKRPLSRTEIAVYASHRLAWRKLLEGGDAAALVLEDDFSLRDPALVATIMRNTAAVLADGRDLVKLFDFGKRGHNPPAFTERAGDVELVKWRKPTAGMVAYLISRKGAEKLLARDRIFRQIDEDTKYFWELDLDIWSVPGNPVEEISDELGGSIVDAERESMKARRILRSIWGNVVTADRKLRTRYHLAREQRRRKS